MLLTRGFGWTSSTSSAAKDPDGAPVVIIILWPGGAADGAHTLSGWRSGIHGAACSLRVALIGRDGRDEALIGREPPCCPLSARACEVVARMLTLSVTGTIGMGTLCEGSRAAVDFEAASEAFARAALGLVSTIGGAMPSTLG